MTNDTATTDIHPGIAEIIASLDALPEGSFLRLEQGDFGFEPRALQARWTRPVSDFAGSCTLEDLRADIDAGNYHWFGQWYRLDGSPIPKAERPEAWMKAEFDPLSRSVKNTVHAAALSPSGHLFVSHGPWFCDEETILAREPAFTFVSWAEDLRRDRAAAAAADAAYLELHAAALAEARPAWTESVSVLFAVHNEEQCNVLFSRTVGGVFIDQIVSPDGEAFVPYGKPTLTIAAGEDLTATEARSLSMDLLSAVALLEGGAK